MARIPVMQETIMPTMKLVVISSGLDATKGSFTRAAPKMIGVDSRKENRAAPSRVSPRTSPVEMVIPDRETPGMIARAWGDSAGA